MLHDCIKLQLVAYKVEMASGSILFLSTSVGVRSSPA